jgi:holo-[acyl-carrier protein] synthase
MRQIETRVAIDIACADEIEESIRVHGQRYLTRVYTTSELRECGTSARRLAARFAAKEATMKVLRRGDEPLPWTSIAVGRDECGSPALQLNGAAADLAERQGLTALALSITDRGGLTAAVVLARGYA